MRSKLGVNCSENCWLGRGPLVLVALVVACTLAAELAGGQPTVTEQQQKSQQHEQQQQVAEQSGAASEAAQPPPGGQQAQQASQLAPPKLPNINIYINKNEIRRILGIDTRINYVSNGNINTYPLGFTIPLGYNQSDIIFTWQNLGTTNVNYSISLMIDNNRAVERPLINITRSGLIPRHEQVFKITLSCSGKVTDEVDVQVLINITGWVPLEAAPDERLDLALDSQQQQQQAAAEQLAAQYQVARAAAAAAGHQLAANQTAPPAPAADQMQADEAPQQQLRLVSHILAIKRKKICTMHPVPVQPIARPTELLRPANQPVLNSQAAPATTTQVEASRWTPGASAESHAIVQQQQQHLQRPNRPTPFQASTTGGSQALLQQGDLQATPQQPQEAPAHHPALSLSAIADQQQQSRAGLFAGAAWPPQLRHQHQAMSAPPSPSPIPPENPLNELQLLQQATPKQQQQQQQQSSASPLLLGLLMLMSLVISLVLIALVLLGLGSGHHHSAAHRRARHPLDKRNLAQSGRCSHGHHLHRQHLHATAAAKCKQADNSSASSASSPSPIAGGFGTSKSGAFTLRGAQQNHSSIVVGANPILRQHHKTISGQSKQQLCYATQASKMSSSNNYGNSYYSTMNYAAGGGLAAGQHSGFLASYQHPPTADLLGTGYQCQQQQQSGALAPPQPPPIYHIATGNTNQTTRLIWQQAAPTDSGNGCTIEGGAYMPLSNGPDASGQARSENGSVYQTIY